MASSSESGESRRRRLVFVLLGLCALVALFIVGSLKSFVSRVPGAAGPYDFVWDLPHPTSEPLPHNRVRFITHLLDQGAVIDIGSLRIVVLDRTWNGGLVGSLVVGKSSRRHGPLKSGDFTYTWHPARGGAGTLFSHPFTVERGQLVYRGHAFDLRSSDRVRSLVLSADGRVVHVGNR